MTKNRWFRLFGMDFLGSRRVIPMNVAERGAYMQLLILAWDDPQCSLPKDDQELQRLAGWSEQFGSFTRVRACFTTHPLMRTRLHNARLYEEFQYCQKKSAAAQESAKTRWQKPTASIPEPVKKANDRTSLGLTAIGGEVAKVADKHFPPI